MGDGTVDVAPAAGHQVSIRAAIQELNAVAGHGAAQVVEFEGVVLFEANIGMIGLSIFGNNEDMAATGDLDIFGDIRVDGSRSEFAGLDGGWVGGMSFADPLDYDRVFHVLPNSKLRIEGLVINGGRVAANGDQQSLRGGGIWNEDGDLTITDSLLGLPPGLQSTDSGSEATLGGFSVFQRRGHDNLRLAHQGQRGD